MKNKETEQILLNDEKYEKLLHEKTKAEFCKIIENTSSSPKTITDYKFVPRNMRFGKNTIYLVINKTSKTKSYINGIQAEGFIDSNTQREKLLDGQVDYFVNGDNYIKFYKFKSCVNS
jgi:Tol biopolymer transport system component